MKVVTIFYCMHYMLSARCSPLPPPQPPLPPPPPSFQQSSEKQKLTGILPDTRFIQAADMYVHQWYISKRYVIQSAWYVRHSQWYISLVPWSLLAPIFDCLSVCMHQLTITCGVCVYTVKRSKPGAGEGLGMRV